MNNKYEKVCSDCCNFLKRTIGCEKCPVHRLKTRFKKIIKRKV